MEYTLTDGLKNRDHLTSRQIGTLEIQEGSERRAVLQIGEGQLTREWIHLGYVDTLERARALTLFATVPVENR